MKWKYLYVSLVPFVENFVKEKSQLYNIDLSHNLHHSQQVKELGFFIAEKDYHLNNRQNEILYLACMLHDMCDPKYTPQVQAILDVSNFLVKKCCVSMLTHDAVMEIITSMSYNQVVKPDGTVQYPYWLATEKSGWGKVYHIVRESDLLTSYDLKRMVHYKCEKLQFAYSSDILQDVLDTVDVRMSKLIEKNLFISPTAKRIASKWHHELCHEILPNLTQDDIYPILNQPEEPVKDFRQRILDSVL